MLLKTMNANVFPLCFFTDLQKNKLENKALYSRNITIFEKLQCFLLRHEII